MEKAAPAAAGSQQDGHSNSAGSKEACKLVGMIAQADIAKQGTMRQISQVLKCISQPNLETAQKVAA